MRPDELPTSAGILTFALRTLALTNYRAEGKFAEAEPHLSRHVALVLVTPGEGVQQTRADMFLLAENYANLKKVVGYSDPALRRLVQAR